MRHQYHTHTRQTSCQALPWLHCLALDTGKTAATLCAQSSCLQLVPPTAAELSPSACGAEARSTVSPPGQTGKHKRVTIQSLGRAHGGQSLGPENTELNIGKQLEAPEGCIIFSSYTQWDATGRKQSMPQGETGNINSVLSEQGEGTLHLKVLLTTMRAPSMHLAKGTEEGVKPAPSPAASAVLSSWPAGHRGDYCSPAPASPSYSASSAQVLRSVQSLSSGSLDSAGV